MGIVGMDEILACAIQGGYAVGYFEAWDQYSLEGTLEAAEALNSPAILGVGGAITSQSWLDHRGIEQQITLARCLAERAVVPTAVLLNEVESFSHIVRGLYAGCNAVMLHTSHLHYRENVALTLKVVEVAHSVGAIVEAELGQLADAGDSVETAISTDPDEAARFVESTGVDALAVSIGNVHTLADGEAEGVDLDLLARIRDVVAVPLVLHGGTGFPRTAVQRAIECGVAKINVGTALKRAFLEGVAEALADVPEGVGVQRLVGTREEFDILARGKSKTKAEAMRLITLYGSAGQVVTS